MYFLLFLLLFFFFHFFFYYFFISGNAAFFAAYTQTKIFVLRIGENEIEKNRDRYNEKKNYNSNKKIVEYSSNDNLSKEDSLRSIRSIQGKGSVQSSVQGSVQSSVQGSVYPTSSPVEENRRKGRSVQILENKIEKNIVFDAEVEKKNLREKNNNKAVLLAGAMAGLAYVLSAHPLEIASVLMQTDVPIQCPQLQHQLQLQLSTVVQKLKMKNLPKYR